MSHLRTKLLSHQRAVCSLYKSILRALEILQVEREDQRFESILMRKRFDDNKNVSDPREAKRLYQEALAEYEKFDQSRLNKYPEAPGGCAYDRWHAYPDWVMDTWHPYEKAMYPKYFATREKRKLEYIENFERLKATWPKEETADGHH